VQVGTVAFTAGDETMEVPEGVAHKFTKLRRRTAQVGGTYTSASGSSPSIFGPDPAVADRDSQDLVTRVRGRGILANTFAGSCIRSLSHVMGGLSAAIAARD
jgi:hypothetical protein